VRRRTADGMALRLSLRRKTESGANVDRGDSLARKRIDGSRACPRVGIVLQRSVIEVAAQRNAEASHPNGGRRPSRGRELDLEVTLSDGVCVARREDSPERFE